MTSTPCVVRRRFGVKGAGITVEWAVVLSSLNIAEGLSELSDDIGEPLLQLPAVVGVLELLSKSGVSGIK